MRLYKNLKLPAYNEAQTNEVVTIIKRFHRFFFWLIIRQDFILKHEQDDYHQHIQLEIWRRYHQFDRNKGPLVPWLQMVAQSAISKYYKFINKDRRRTDYVEDCSSWYDVADTIYAEAEIESLHNAIADLPANDKHIVQVYLSGANMRSESRSIGKGEDYYGRRLDKIKKHIRDRRGQYFENTTISNKKPWKGWTGGLNNEKAGCKAIHMLSSEGAFIKRYPSIAEAMRDGFQSAALNRCLNKGGTHEGYRWIYEGETREKILNWRNKRTAGDQGHAQPIEQWSLAGEYIQTFPTMAAAGRAGFAPGNIHKVIKGICHHHKGYNWRYPAPDANVHSMNKKTAV